MNRLSRWIGPLVIFFALIGSDHQFFGVSDALAAPTEHDCGYLLGNSVSTQGYTETHKSFRLNGPPGGNPPPVFKPITLTDQKGPGNVSLYGGHCLVSKNGRFFTTIRDNEFVVVDSSNNSIVWSTKTAHSGATRLAVQSDSNLVLYEGDTANWVAWSSDTSSAARAPLFLTLWDDGGLALYKDKIGTSSADLTNRLWASTDPKNGVGTIHSPAINADQPPPNSSIPNVRIDVHYFSEGRKCETDGLTHTVCAGRNEQKIGLNYPAPDHYAMCGYAFNTHDGALNNGRIIIQATAAGVSFFYSLTPLMDGSGSSINGTLYARWIPIKEVAQYGKQCGTDGWTLATTKHESGFQGVQPPPSGAGTSCTISCETNFDDAAQCSATCQ